MFWRRNNIVCCCYSSKLGVLDVSFFNAWCGMKMFRGVLDSQMLQPGQISEGPLLNDPQAVNILHRTAGERQSEGENQQ